MPEILSCVEVALPHWKLEHLSLWNEIVSPMVADDTQPEDIHELEETTVAAQFCEVKSKIALLACSSVSLQCLVCWQRLLN